jgi:hypothetical protein
MMILKLFVMLASALDSRKSPILTRLKPGENESKQDRAACAVICRRDATLPGEHVDAIHANHHNTLRPIGH